VKRVHSLTRTRSRDSGAATAEIFDEETRNFFLAPPTRDTKGTVPNNVRSPFIITSHVTKHQYFDKKQPLAKFMRIKIYNLIISI